MNSGRMSRRALLKLMGSSVMAIGVAACAAPAPGGTASEPAADAGPVTLRVMVWGGAENAETRDRAVRGVYPELDEQSKVEVVVGGAGDFEVADAVRLALAAGTDIPNIVQFNRTQIAEFAAAKELLELEEAWGAYKDDMYAGAVDLCMYEGSLVCYPYEVKSKVFHYRQDMLDGMGVSTADMKTTGDFLAIGKAFHETYPNSYLLNLGPQPAQYWLGELLSAWPDARMADEGGNYLVAEHQAFADTFQFIKDIYDSGLAAPIDDWSSDWQQAFADEMICGSLIASWMKFFLPKFAPEQGGQWGTSLWPELAPLADQRYGSEAGGSVLVVPKRSEHLEASTEYLNKMFLDKDGALACYEVTGMTPLMQSARDTLMEAAANLEKPDGMSDEDWNTQPNVFFGSEYQAIELDSYNYVKVFPYDPSATKEIDILHQWLIKFLANEATLVQALDGAQADMEGQIGNPYQV